MIEVLKLALKALNAGEHAHLIMNTDGIKDKVRQAIAGLESQEPVALETVYETIIQWDEGGGKRSRRDLARRIIDLYTHPPQRTEQEPVAWMREDATLRFADGKMFAVGQPFYTQPPQRPWVGLTDEDIEDIFQIAAGADEETHIRFARAIESALRSKNK